MAKTANGGRFQVERSLVRTAKQKQRASTKPQVEGFDGFELSRSKGKGGALRALRAKWKPRQSGKSTRSETARALVTTKRQKIQAGGNRSRRVQAQRGGETATASARARRERQKLQGGGRQTQGNHLGNEEGRLQLPNSFAKLRRFARFELSRIKAETAAGSGNGSAKTARR